MSNDDHELPNLSFKKAILPVVIISGFFIFLGGIFTIPKIIVNFIEKDIDAAISLIIEMLGIVLFFGGLLIMRINSVKKKRLEVELDFDEPEDKYASL